MWYIACVLCLLLGGVFVWYFWVRDLKMNFHLCQTNRDLGLDTLKKLRTDHFHLEKVYKELSDSVKAVHSISFAPGAKASKYILDTWNFLWRHVGLEEKGEPR